jgi:hypothetical protein
LSYLIFDDIFGYTAFVVQVEIEQAALAFV